MRRYRITKYNPKLRNDEGAYLDNSEWTSISDVPNKQRNGLTFKGYLKIENGYLDAIKVLLEHFEQKELEVSELELHNSETEYLEYQEKGFWQNIELDFDDIKKLKIGDTLKGITLDNACRLTLREFLWMNLKSDKLNIIFGYDYYMYVECEAIATHLIKFIEAKGLFVE